MVAITATNSATPSNRVVMIKARLEQAQREAGQAEFKAQSLRTQADAAEIDARQSRENVRTLYTNSRQSPPTYDDQIKKAPEVPTKTQDFLVNMYAATSDKFAANGNSLKKNPNATPVVNSQGHSTGRILNLST
jgi:hypothetical protein